LVLGALRTRATLKHWPVLADAFLMGSFGQGQGVARSVSQRLKAATDELQALEKLVVSGDCAPRVLSDFRGAVDSIRQTAWAVQQWSDLQQQNRDPYSVLGILQEERVRRATQIARDLTLDLESLDLDLETAGLAELFRAIEALHRRLTPLFRKI
jgi:hypothetical protein